VNDAGVAADAAAIASLAAGRPALVYRRQLADTETPVAAALKLIEPGRGDFLLESVEDGATRGRYSLLGLAPDLVFRADGQNAAINRDWLRNRDAFVPTEAETLPALRALVAECRAEVPEGLPPALACLVGYLAY
jgi:anthranilate synthase component 1